MRTLVATLAALLAGPAAADAPPHRATGDLAIRARHILTTYCGKCHGEKAASGRLNVFDHRLYVPDPKGGTPVPPAPFAAKDRPLIVEFIRDGSMPLGNHPRPTDGELTVLEDWVKADTPEYPRQFEVAQTTAAILADWNAAREKPDRIHTRYVTLAHLLQKPANSSDELNGVIRRLGEAEGQLRKLLTATGNASRLTPVDAAATTFRFDIRDVKWHHTGLFKLTDDTNDVFDMIPFDLLWLEYPYAHGAAPAPEVSAAVAEMNPHHPKPNPFRPQLFLRGDWLAAQLLDGDKPTPLAEELAALAALGEVKDDEAKRKELKGPKPRPFATAKSEPPAPVTSWHARDTAAPAGGLTLTAEAKLNGGPVPPELPTGSKIGLTLTLNRAGVVQLADVTLPDFPRGWHATTLPLKAGGNPAANQPTVLSVNAEHTFTLNVVGTQYYVVYAAAAAFKPVVVVSSHQSGNYPIFRVFPADATIPVARQVIPLTVVDVKKKKKKQ